MKNEFNTGFNEVLEKQLPKDVIIKALELPWHLPIAGSQRLEWTAVEAK